MTDVTPLVVGVIADTHIPDRVAGFHPDLFPSLRDNNVQAIFHAGDISSPAVLTALAEIAPVTAVRGNRDWLFRNSLPTLQKIELLGVKIALLHGHINFAKYLKDKWSHITRGYRLERYLPRLLTAWPEAQVIVFGHTHQPLTLWINNRLIFTPGSCTTKSLLSPNPHYGILQIYPDGRIETKTIELTGYRLKLHQWIPERNQ